MSRFKKLLQVLCCYLCFLGKDLKVLTIYPKANTSRFTCCEFLYSVVCKMIFEDSQKYETNFNWFARDQSLTYLLYNA